MKIVGCDLHARQQSIAVVDTETGEFTEKLLKHEGNAVRDFYASLEGPVVVGIEATGSMQWFLELLEELGIKCRVGHPAKIRAASEEEIGQALEGNWQEDQLFVLQQEQAGYEFCQNRSWSAISSWHSTSRD